MSDDFDRAVASIHRRRFRLFLIEQWFKLLLLSLLVGTIYALVEA